MTTYYVKNGGNDNLDGLSDATAWASLGKAAGANVGGGDSILFKRGSRWREEFICYRGGASTSSRLTFGAYGTGTAPIIDGSDIATGWTAETSGGSSGNGENFTDATGTRPIAWWDFAEATGTRASTAGGGNGLVPSTSSPSRGTGPHGQFSTEFVKASSQQFDLPESSMSTNFPGRSTLANGSLTVGGWVRVDAETGGDAGIWGKDTNHQLMIEGSTVIFRIFSTNNATVAVSGEGTTYSAGTWRHYVCRYTQATGEMVLFVNGVKKTPQTIATRNVFTGPFTVGNATFKSNFDGAVAELFVSDAAMTDAQILSIYNTGLTGSRVTSGPTLYWKSYPSKTGAVFVDGNPLQWVQTKGDVTAGKEWWDDVNSRQYIRLVAEENPANHTVEVARRVYPMRLQGTNYWTVEDLWVRGALKANFFADTNNDAIVRRCTLSHATENGIHVYTHTNISTFGFEISDCVCYNNGACGITVAGNFATSMAGIRIRRNETYSNCWQPRAKENAQFSYTGGIRPIGREINDCIVEDNYVHDEGNDGDLSHGEGIWLDTVGLNCIVRRNKIERTTSWGVQIEDCDAVRVHSNLVINTLYYPGIAIIRNCDDNLVYNNTLINCQGGFNISNGGGSRFFRNQFYNNIVYQSAGWVVLADNGATGSGAATFNKNIIGPNRTNMFNTNGTQYSTLAAWESNWGATSNSISSNPTFVNLAAGDYHLAAGSVGRSAGVAIPAGTLDYTSFLFSGTPSIGAFEVTSANATTGTSALRLKALTGTGTGTRTSTLTGISALRFPMLTGTGIATRSLPGTTGNSALFLKPLIGLSGGTRTIPERSGSAPLTLRALALSALGTVGVTNSRTGNSALRLRALTLISAGAVGTARIANSALRLFSLRGIGSGTRTLPNRSGSSALRLLLLRHTGLGVRTVPGAIDIIQHVNAPAWRTADFGDGNSRVVWRSPLDPGEKKAYTINCGTELSDITNRIEIVNISLSGLAILAGLRIRAMSYDRSNITLWLEINPADQVKPNWSGAGEVHTMTCTIDVTDGQRFERDVSLQIKQIGQT
jgi:concanavalin A-like lectin/glucanase superfamily protein/parallel beta helix pectate lyase-like protein